jgi:hypothetical protein
MTPARPRPGNALWTLAPLLYQMEVDITGATPGGAENISPMSQWTLRCAGARHLHCFCRARCAHFDALPLEAATREHSHSGATLK